MERTSRFQPAKQSWKKCKTKSKMKPIQCQVPEAKPGPETSLRKPHLKICCRSVEKRTSKTDALWYTMPSLVDSSRKSSFQRRLIVPNIMTTRRRSRFNSSDRHLTQPLSTYVVLNQSVRSIARTKITVSSRTKNQEGPLVHSTPPSP
jgi:hypothetical protein